MIKINVETRSTFLPEVNLNKIFPRLINLKTYGEEILYNGYPYRRVCGDLATLLCVPYDIDGEKGWSIVTKQMLGEIASEFAFEAAYKNLEASVARGDTVIKSMVEVVQEALADAGIIYIDSPNSDAPTRGMMVVTNKEKYYGATYILSHTVRKKIREMLGEEYYILPSSTEEVIVMRESEGDIDSLEELVRSVNKTLLPRQFLSDTIYFSNGASIVPARERMAA